MSDPPHAAAASRAGPEPRTSRQSVAAASDDLARLAAGPANTVGPAGSAGASAPGRRSERLALIEAVRRTVERSHSLGSWLAEVSRHLPTLEEQGAFTVESALASTDALAALLFRASGAEADAHLLLEASAELPPRVAGALRELPMAAAGPFGEAARSRQPVIAGRRAEIEARWPEMRTFIEPLDVHAVCAVPVTYLGHFHGVLALVHGTPRRFGRAELATLRTLGARYARALRASRLYLAERAARSEAEQARREAEAARHELAETHRLLEQRVAERTRELEHAIARLADEVAQRVRAEAERNALRQQLARAEEAERRRLAREVHDQLGAHLTAFSLGLAEVRRLLADGAPAEAKLAQLEELSHSMTRDVRLIALQLRPPELDDVSLESALRTYAQQWSARCGVTVDVAGIGLGAHRLLAEDVTTAIYRIAQEALTNVARHAHAAAVSVVVDVRPAEARLIVEDDGRGFDPAVVNGVGDADRRLGLAGMHERAALVGGSVEIDAAPGRGTTVLVRIPLDAERSGT